MKYFHMKTKILADFQICISVPLTVAERDENVQSTIDWIQFASITKLANIFLLKKIAN